MRITRVEKGSEKVRAKLHGAIMRARLVSVCAIMRPCRARAAPTCALILGDLLGRRARVPRGDARVPQRGAFASARAHYREYETSVLKL
jgi:hypothetical protein